MEKNKQNEMIAKKLSYHQKNRFYRIFSDNFYLLDVLKYPENTKFFISGSSKNVYTVTIFENRKISCNCPDMKSWAKESDCICKHCCFVLFRVLDLKDYYSNNEIKFFKNLEFDDDEYEFIEKKMLGLVSKFNLTNLNKDNNIVNLDLIKKYNKIKELKVENGKEKYEVKSELDRDTENGTCPICFLELENEEIVRCPCCNNIIHKECMEKWLRMGKSNCVYCRSDVWKDYLNSENEYKNLNSVLVE